MKAVIILFQKEMKACNSQPAVALRPAPPATPPVRQAGRPGAQGQALVFAVALLGPPGLGAGPQAALTRLCRPGQSCLPAGEAWTSWKSILPGSSLLLWSPPPAPNSHRKPSGICTPRQTTAQGQRSRALRVGPSHCSCAVRFRRDPCTGRQLLSAGDRFRWELLASANPSNPARHCSPVTFRCHPTERQDKCQSRFDTHPE